MNLLKSTGFLLKSLYLRPFHHSNIRGDFRIFSKLLVSFQAFAGNFGKNVGKFSAFTNEIVTQKLHTVKATLAKKKSLRPKPEADDHSMEYKKITNGIFEAPIVK